MGCCLRMLTCSNLQESYTTTRSSPISQMLKRRDKSLHQNNFLLCRTFFSSPQCSPQRELVTSSFPERSARFYEAVKQNMREEDMMWWHKGFFCFLKVTGDVRKNMEFGEVSNNKVGALSVCCVWSWVKKYSYNCQTICLSITSLTVTTTINSLKFLWYIVNRENHWTVYVWVL